MDSMEQQRHSFNLIFRKRDAIYRQIMQSAELPEISYQILYSVCEGEKSWTQTDICRERDYPKQSVNSAIAKLVQRGLVELVSDKNALKNRKIVRLTQQGETFCDRWVRPVVDADKKAFASLSAEERELYVSFMERERQIVEDSLKELLDTSSEGSNE